MLRQLWINSFLLVSLCMISLSSAQESDEALKRAKTFRRDLAHRLKHGLLHAQDIEKALQFYLAGRALGSKESERQIQLYLQGMEAIKEESGPLPRVLRSNAVAVGKLEFLETLELPKDIFMKSEVEEVTGITCQVVRFKVSKLTEYGVIMRPKAAGRYPLILFLHGAAFGIPDYTLPWMARLAAEGYVVAAPSFRGEDLLLRRLDVQLSVPQYRSEGEIENLLGEVDDVLVLAEQCLSLDFVAGGKYAIIGHSFGAGAGLLAAARSEKVACVVSYDAWMTNPFRFYWERLAAEGTYDNKSFLWGSWEEFMKLPADKQLSGLLERSIVHQADKVVCPLLLFMGGAYNGSAYHDSHHDLVEALKQHKKMYQYEIMPGGGHNFVLYASREPAVSAYKMQMGWLAKYHPASGQRAGKHEE